MLKLYKEVFFILYENVFINVKKVPEVLSAADSDVQCR